MGLELWQVFCGNRIVSPLAVPENGYNPIPVTVLQQLKAIDPARERFLVARAVTGLVRCENVDQMAETLHLLGDSPLEETIALECSGDPLDILIDGHWANVGVPVL